MIPQTFSEWQYCITEKCKINMTPTFAKQRLSIYEDLEHQATKEFAALYGLSNLNNIISWL